MSSEISIGDLDRAEGSSESLESSVRPSPTPRRITVFSTPEHARSAVLRGVDLVANTVGITLGPSGRRVMLSTPGGSPEMTIIGSRIARQIELADPLERLGAEMVKEAAHRTAEIAGDGSATASVLAQAIFREGLKAVAAGESPIVLKRSIDAAIAEIADRIRKTTKHLSEDMVSQFATVAASGDEQIGELVARAIAQLGEYGFIIVERSKTDVPDVEKTLGLQFDRGYLSPYFVTDEDNDRCVLETPYVLVTESSIQSMVELLPLLEQIARSGRSLLVIANRVEGEALATLVANKLRGTMCNCAVTSPEHGLRRDAALQDIALITGARTLTPAPPAKFPDVRTEDLGSAERVIVGRNRTTIINGNGSPVAIARHLTELRSLLSTSTSEERNELQSRMARLSNGIVVLRVAAFTESEVIEKKARAEAAIRTTLAALKGGTVAGGGIALLKASRHLHLDENSENADHGLGARVVIRACEAVVRQIPANAGFDGNVVLHYINQTAHPEFGFNARNGRFENLVRAGIADSAQATITALESAASVATNLLTAGGFVYAPETRRRLINGVVDSSVYGLIRPVFPWKEWESINQGLEDILNDSDVDVPVEDESNDLPGDTYIEGRLYGIAHIVGSLEADALRVGEHYSLEVGLVRDGSFRGREEVTSPSNEIMFVAVVQETGSLELSRWHQQGKLSVDQDFSLLRFSFRATDVGSAGFVIQFYHRRQWIARLVLPVSVLERRRSASQQDDGALHE